MLILPIIIILLLIASGFVVDASDPFTVLTLISWIILFLNSVLVSLGGYNLSRNFSKEVRLQTEAGFPIQSLDGFPETQSSIRKVFASSFFISIIVFFSLLTYVAVVLLQAILSEGLNEVDTENLLKSLSSAD